jgi:hypothetical protein
MERGELSGLPVHKSTCLYWFDPNQGQRSLYTGASDPSKRGAPTLPATPKPNRTPSRRRSERGSPVAGLRYGRLVHGKRLFRIRERHVAEHLIPLIADHAVGAAKLDIVLRGVALQEAHAKRREVGLVLPRYSWEELHDLARTPRGLGDAPSDLDPSSKVVRLKRKWVGEQLARLEESKLLRREPQPGKRPKLLVLRDDGTGEPLDDPDGQEGNTYVTILGAVIASGKLAHWGAPAVSAYLAAMVAERHDRAAQGSRGGRPGEGPWFRSASWFADVDGKYGPPARVRLPFSVPTLERGLTQLRAEDLIYWQRLARNPQTMQRLAGPRNFYRNRFGRLEAAKDVLEPQEYADQLASDEEVV